MAAASPLSPPLSHPALSPLPGPARSPLPRLPRMRPLLVGALLVLAVALGFVTVRDGLASLAPGDPPIVTEAHATGAARARVRLLEWRWAPPGVDAARMFRRPASAKRAQRGRAERSHGS